MDDIVVLLLIVVALGLVLIQRAKVRHQNSLDFCQSQGFFSSFKAPARKKQEVVYEIQSEEIDRALFRISHYVVRDFVLYWFTPNVSTNHDFPNDVRFMIDHTFAVFGKQVSRIDWPTFVAEKIITSLSELIRVLRLTEDRLSKSDPEFDSLGDVERCKRLEKAILESHNLHVAVVKEPTKYLRKVSDALASKILRKRDYSCDVVRSLIREVLTNNILMPTMGFVEPYWVNCGIVACFEAAMSKSEEIVQALEQEVAKDKHPTDAPSAPTTLTEAIVTDLSHNLVESTDRVRAASDRTSEKAVDGVSPSGSRQSRSQSSDANVVASLKQSDTQHTTQNDSESTERQRANTHALGDASKESLTLQRLEWEREKLRRRGTHAGDKALTAKLGIDPSLITSASIPEAAEAADEGSADEEDVANNRNTRALDVKIVDYACNFDSGRKPYVEYLLKVRNGLYYWHVPKRFREFDELNKKLNKIIPDLDARLPTKKFFGNLDQQFLADRKKALQKYLDRLLWNKNVVNSEPFQLFTVPSMDTELKPTSRALTQEEQTVAVGKTEDLAEFTAALQREAEEGLSEGEEGVIAGDLIEESAALPTESDNRLEPDPKKRNKLIRGLKSFKRKLGTITRLRRNKDGARSRSSTLSDDSDADHSAHTGEDSARDGEIKQSSSLPRDTMLHLPKEPAPESGNRTSPNSPRVLAKPRPPNLNRASTWNGRDFDEGAAAEEDASAKPQAKAAAHEAEEGKPTKKKHSFFKPSSELAQRRKLIIQPLFGLADEVFALNERGFVRRQISWLVSQMVNLTMGSNVRSWFEETVRWHVGEESISSWISWITDLVWPGGELFKPAPPPSEEIMEEYRLKCREYLDHCLPGSVTTLLGKGPCRKGLLRLYSFCQIRPLVRHFAFKVMDDVLQEMFPDLQKKMEKDS